MKFPLKKILLTIFVITPLFVVKAFAATSGITVSPSSLEIEVGSSKTFTITAYNAIGDAEIVSNNPSIASVNVNEWTTGMIGDGETKTGTVTVYGNAVGSTTITLTLDAATFEGVDLSGQTRTVAINVVAEPTPEPEPTPTPEPKPAPAPDPGTNQKNNKTPNTPDTGKETKEKDTGVNTLPLLFGGIAVIVAATITMVIRRKFCNKIKHLWK